MNIIKNGDGEKLIIALDGRLDTTTSPELEATLSEALEGVTDFELNLEKLAYISSAGLRILLNAQKRMNKQGKMKLTNVSEDIMDIFEITGFAGILTIE